MALKRRSFVESEGRVRV